MMTEHEPAFAPGETIKAKVTREVSESNFALRGCCLRQVSAAEPAHHQIPNCGIKIPIYRSLQVKPKAKIDGEVKAFLQQLFLRGVENSGAKVELC